MIFLNGKEPWSHLEGLLLGVDIPVTAVTSLMKEQEWDMERSRRSSKDNLHKRLVLLLLLFLYYVVTGSYYYNKLSLILRAGFIKF